MSAILANPRNKYIMYRLSSIWPIFSFQLIKVTAGIYIKKSGQKLVFCWHEENFRVHILYSTSYYLFCIFAKVVCEMLEIKNKIATNRENFCAKKKRNVGFRQTFCKQAKNKNVTVSDVSAKT
jgi:hypothetical protein